MGDRDRLPAVEELVEALDGVGGMVAADLQVDPEQKRSEVVARCVMDLPAEGRAQFMERFEAREWRVLMVCNDRHPGLDMLIGWARSKAPGEVLMLATPSGPPAPQVMMWQRDL